jgi:hypothetical protein
MRRYSPKWDTMDQKDAVSRPVENGQLESVFILALETEI